VNGCIGPDTPTVPEERMALPGFVQVSVSTTGANPDPDGYELTVDEGASQSVAVNGSVTFSGLSTGTHQVTLSGVADHCTVESSNPQSFTIIAGTTVEVHFQVHCP
jgi:hypothetical protein